MQPGEWTSDTLRARFAEVRAHTERLAAYWAEALGGPMTFSTEYGDETSVVRMHSGNGAHDEMDRRAIACFDQALADVGLTSSNARDPWRALPRPPGSREAAARTAERPKDKEIWSQPYHRQERDSCAFSTHTGLLAGENA